MSLLSRNKTLIFCIIASICWHAIWLSAIKIVAPAAREPVKFSTAAFLGPVPDVGAMEVRMAPSGKTFLETRLSSYIYGIGRPGSGILGNKFEADAEPKELDRKMIYLINNSVGGDKVDPGPSDSR